MLARVQSYLLTGIDAHPCEVEVDNDPTQLSKEDGSGTGKALIVGLPDAAVKESLERVRTALSNSNYLFPGGKTLVNLAPADVKKEGPLYDLPIAVGLLMGLGIIGPKIKVQSGRVQSSKLETGSRSTGVERALFGREAMLPRSPSPHSSSPHSSSGLTPSLHSSSSPEGLDPREYLFAGELALDGRLRPVKGVLAMAALAESKGYKGVIVPADNAAEASVIQSIQSIGVRTLNEVVGLLNGTLEIEPHPPMDIAAKLEHAEAPIDFAEVRGQEAVKRAIIVAASGSHNLVGLGPRARDGAGAESGIWI